MKQENLIKLGTCHRPHGIKGGFLFRLYNQQDSILKAGHEIFIFPENENSSVSTKGEKFEVQSIHFENKTICYFKNIKERNVVEKMLPFSIFVDVTTFPKTQENEYYIKDLIGLDVFNQDGYKVGKVEAFYENGAQVILKLKVDGENLELPFVDTFFPFVDLKKNKIVFIGPEYE